MYTLLLVIIYIAFVSLGLPDSVLGAAWPSMHQTLQVPEGYAGLITLLIYTGTTISSMATGWLNQRLGTGKVILFSVMLTAITMYGFSISDHFLQLCAWALPYGLGVGCGPIFPCMIHHSPCLVGTANSQTLIGMQLGAASAGSILMPALFGVIVQHLHIGFLPLYALLFSFLLMECLRRLPVCHTPGHPPTESM